jgi:type IV secretion/conjugal transfer VirB4 family ATPase
MLSLKEYREPTFRLPDRLPWAALVAPGTIINKDGNVQKTIMFRGPDLASSSKTQLAGAVARLNNALRRLGSGWAIFSEAQRFESNHYPSAFWPCPAAWLIDRERRESFKAAGSHFESAYYLTFVWRMPSDRRNKWQAVFFEDPETKKAADHTARDLLAFRKQVAEIVGIMASVFAEVRELDDAETLTYLHSTVSTNWHPVRVPEIPMYLDGYLADQAFTPGEIPMLGMSSMPCCTVVGFPSSSVPGLLDELNHLRVPYRWSLRWIAFDKEEAESELGKFRKRWQSKVKGILTHLKEEATKTPATWVNNAAANKAADADAALQELGEDFASYGLVTVTVTVWNTDVVEARKQMQAVKRVIETKGFTVKDETTFNSTLAWLGTHPGNVYANVRRPIINSLNLAHIMPLSAIWCGDRENRYMKEKTGVGHAHITCNTIGDTPFRLNLNLDDVGHFAIFGRTGAGKSVLLRNLEAQWLKYPNAQVIVFDKDRSALAMTLAMGGSFYEPGNSDRPCAFQPLRNVDQRAERIWAAAEFVPHLFEAQGERLTPERKLRIEEALQLMATEPPEQRTLTTLVTFLGPELGDILRPYTLGGNYGSIFDADHDSIATSFWTMFEMGHLLQLGAEAVLPALDYLFHKIEARFDGRPTLLVLDEVWLMMAHPVFRERIKNWLKTLRKKFVFVGFATQELADVANSPLLPTIMSACGTKIYLADEDAPVPTTTEQYQAFGLTEEEITILARAQRKRDYYVKTAKGRRLFQLGLGQVALAIAGMASPEDQQFLDHLIDEVPREQHLNQILLRRGLTWAPDLLREAVKHPLYS